MLLLHSLQLGCLPVPLAAGHWLLRFLFGLGNRHGTLACIALCISWLTHLCCVAAASLWSGCSVGCCVGRGRPNRALPLLLIGRLGGALAAQARHIVLRHPLLAAAAAAAACRPQGCAGASR